MRTLSALCVLGVLTLSLQAGEEPLAGNWKVFVIEDGQAANLWLVRLENKAGKWAGTAEGLKGVPETVVSDIKMDGDLVHVELKIRNGPKFEFEGKTPRAGAKKVLGSITREGRSIPAYLEATAAKNSFEIDREIVTRTPNDPRVFGTVLDLINDAKENKIDAKEVQEWVDTVLRSAEGYGPRFQLDYLVKLIARLGLQKDYASIGGPLAAKAESMLDPKASPVTQIRFLSALADAAREGAPPELVRGIQARVEKLEGSAYADYSKTALDFIPAKFKGRKGKSDRAVMVELFTGAQCPPCVAADVGFDGLEKAFPTSEVVLLQYHLHIPGPDALTAPDSEKRAEYYGRSLRGTPSIFVNGKQDKNIQGGGGREDGEDKYKEYRAAIEPLLEKPAGAQLQVKAVRKGDKITIQANVKEVEKTGESTRLRLALVEDWVRYRGTNGTLYHHRVVRALPGGSAGLALTKKEAEHSATVDLAELRASLGKYLDNFAKNEKAFPDAQRPMRMRNLHVVAFVQNDDTYEVLQAADAEVKDE